MDFSLSNDGGGVAAENIVEVVWLEGEVRVTLQHFDTTQETVCTLSYDGTAPHITRYIPTEAEAI